MRKFGLIGYPLGHSFSKQYFSDKFRKESITDCEYENFELEKIDHLVSLIRTNPGLCGFNVTIPYKTKVMEYLDAVDDEALDVGAVNVVKISGNRGKKVLKGYNTDVYGFRESLVPHLKSVINQAIILGTGGSSRAISWVLDKLGINHINVSRKPDGYSISYEDLSDKIITDSLLIINATPLGMYPDIHTKPEINYNCLTRSHILYDLVYNPEITAFLESGRERGCKIIGGFEMLRLQAEKSWEIWNDDRY